MLTSTGTVVNWEAAGGGGGGDFSGPGSATDNAIVRFDGTGGKTGQNSGVTIDDSNNATGFANLTLSGELDAATGDFSGDVNVAGELQTANIGYTDGDNAMTIADGGAVAFAQDVTIADGSGLISGNTARVQVGYATGENQILGTGDADANLSITRFSDDNGPPNLFFGKSRGGLGDVDSIVADGDPLGRIIFCGSDGVDMRCVGAVIEAECDGEFEADNVSGRIVFATTPDDPGVVDAVERMRITSNGNVHVTSTSQVSQSLYTNQTTHYASIQVAESQNNVAGLAFGVGSTHLTSTASATHHALIQGIVTNSGGALTGELAFLTNGGDQNTERLRIKSDGDIQVGTNGDLRIGNGVLEVDATGTYGNANMSQGITLNQGASDNEIFALKSSDVAHGCTDQTETDTFFKITKNHGSYGGVNLNAYQEAGESSPFSMSVATGWTGDTTKSGGATGYFRMNASLISGTGVAAPSSNRNLLVIRNAGTTEWLVDNDGDVYYDGSTNASQSWDDYDDVGLLSTFRNLTTDNKAQDVFGQFVEDNAQILHDTGVIQRNDDGHHFVSTKGLNALIIDTIRQEGQKWRKVVEEYQDKIAALEQRLLRLEA